MESFWTYLKRNGLMLWLANLLGQLAVSAVIIAVYFILGLIGLIVGLGAAAFSISSILSLDSFSELETANLSIGLTVGIILFCLIIFLVTLCAGAFQTAGLYATTNEAFTSNRVRISTYFVQGFRYIWKFVQLLLWCVLLEIPIFLLVGFAIALFSFTDEFGMIFGILLLIIAVLGFILLGMALMFSPLLIIAERMRPWQAIVQSFRIVRHNIGRVLLVMLLILASIGSFIIIILLASLILFLPLSLSIFDPTGIVAGLMGIVIYILQWVISIVATPLIMVLIGLIIAYHYYKYFRPQLFPNGSELTENAEPTFTFKSDEF